MSIKRECPIYAKYATKTKLNTMKENVDYRTMKYEVITNTKITNMNTFDLFVIVHEPKGPIINYVSSKSTFLSTHLIANVRKAHSKPNSVGINASYIAPEILTKVHID